MFSEAGGFRCQAKKVLNTYKQLCLNSLWGLVAEA